MKVCLISVRADVGGGPECLWRICANLPAVTFMAALPREEPYWTAVSNQLGELHCFELPHRRFDVLIAFRLARWCLSEGCGCIHAHGRGAGFYARFVSLLTGLPSVTTRHGFIRRWDWKSRLAEILEIVSVAYSRGEVACSNSELRALKLLHGGDCDLMVVNNGVRNLPPGTPPDSVRIAHVTRFVRQKNSDFLLSLVPRLVDSGLRDFRFDIYGDGEGRAEFESKVRDAGLSVYFAFHGNVSNLAEHLGGSTLMVSTSLWEGMPLALLEAMAVGCPVVASAVAGNIDVILNGFDGYLCELEPSVFAQKILDLCRSRAHFSSNAIKSVRRRFSQEAMMCGYNHIYKHVTNANSHV